MAELGHFWQAVVEQGYEWQELPVLIEGRDGGAAADFDRTLVLRPKQHDSPLSYRSYKPLEKSQLFRRFARLAESDVETLREAMTHFANEYGQLGKPVTVWAADDPGWDGVGPPRLKGVDVDTYDGWARAIEQMSHAVRLLRLIQDADEEAEYDLQSRPALEQLEQLIIWDGTPDDPVCSVKYRPDPSLRLATRDSFSTVWPNHAYVFEHYADTLFAAKCFVQKWVYKALDGHCTPLLLWDVQKKYNPESRRDETREFIAFRNIPDGLHAAMWLQVAEVLTGERRFRQCQNPKCQEWFEVGSEAGRKDTKYCSPSCKNAVNNARRPTTRPGRKKGRPPHSA